jgi:ACR3 family arsenite efflux pump ArsB
VSLSPNAILEVKSTRSRSNQGLNLLLILLFLTRGVFVNNTTENIKKIGIKLILYYFIVYERRLAH